MKHCLSWDHHVYFISSVLSHLLIFPNEPRCLNLRRGLIDTVLVYPYPDALPLAASISKPVPAFHSSSDLIFPDKSGLIRKILPRISFLFRTAPPGQKAQHHLCFITHRKGHTTCHKNFLITLFCMCYFQGLQCIAYSIWNFEGIPRLIWGYPQTFTREVCSWTPCRRRLY